MRIDKIYSAHIPEAKEGVPAPAVVVVGGGVRGGEGGVCAREGGGGGGEQPVGDAVGPCARLVLQVPYIKRIKDMSQRWHIPSNVWHQ